ncbi:hypothetical protein [Campylobacter sp. US33a]|uniref:Integral membrane protein n=1 Tax=Campylobacter sp. CCS1377 TaxID=3158229 RepID=A0AAU7E7R3_9BACT|nr:hypothetical protein [Campylobacter sp. US33a]TEY04078.1 hypothetical protein ELQ16_02220 [Campylobacter sp. US33a]
MKVFFSIALLLNFFILLTIFIFRGLTPYGFLSYEFSFFATLLIIFTSFMTYKKNILKKSLKYNFKTKPLNIFIKKIQKDFKFVKFKEFNDDFKPSLTLALKNSLIFFSGLKLLGYGFLVLGFLILQNHQYLAIFEFIAGICIVPLAVFIFMIYLKYESKKNY